MASKPVVPTAVLILMRVTPVIQVVFGAYKLATGFVASGKVYLKGELSQDWREVLGHLQSLARLLKLTDAEGAGDDVKADLVVVLHGLARAFQTDADSPLWALIERLDITQKVTLDELFVIARAFDDGHDLTSFGVFKAPGWTATFAGAHVTLSASAEQLRVMGEAMESALAGGEPARAASVLRQFIGNVLESVPEADAREVLRRALIDQLAYVPAREFAQFPNGRVWRVTDEVRIQGTVRVPGYEQLESLAARTDAIAEAVTGSVDGLAGISCQYRGGELVSFSGEAELEAPDIRWLDQEPEALAHALELQYGLTADEAWHAVRARGSAYDNESSLEVQGSFRCICTPAYPQACDYARVVVDGFEVAYWNSDEWRTDPEDVIGALMGAAKGTS